MAEALDVDDGDLVTPSVSEMFQRSADIEWSDQKLHLSHFENDSSLPQVVKFEEDSSQGATLSPGLKLYSQQPVLLYVRTCKNQVRARTIYRDKSGPYFEVGQTLVIPDDFEGWFELVPPDFGRGVYCRTIADIAAIMPRKFFTRSNITGIRIQEGDGGEQTYLERKVPAGSVLPVVGTFAAKWKTNVQKGVFKKKEKEYMTYEIKYLKCTDRDEQEILIPFQTQGKFNTVYYKGSNDGRSVFRIKDLISDFTLPLKVKLIYGKAPVVPCIFTGTLILKSNQRADSIVGSTILNKRNVLFDLPINSPCTVQEAENEDSYSEMDTYKDARKLCHKYALSYSSLVKLSPELDTHQQMIQHIPTVKSKNAESLKTLDLITNISLTDDEPSDQFMGASDTDSIQSAEQLPMPEGKLVELTELQRRTSTIA